MYYTFYLRIQKLESCPKAAHIVKPEVKSFPVMGQQSVYGWRLNFLDVFQGQIPSGKKTGPNTFTVWSQGRKLWDEDILALQVTNNWKPPLFPAQEWLVSLNCFAFAKE